MGQQQSTALDQLKQANEELKKVNEELTSHVQVVEGWLKVLDEKSTVTGQPETKAKKGSSGSNEHLELKVST